MSGMKESQGFALLCGLTVGGVLLVAVAVLLAVAGVWPPAGMAGVVGAGCLGGAALMAFGST